MQKCTLWKVLYFLQWSCCCSTNAVLQFFCFSPESNTRVRLQHEDKGQRHVCHASVLLSHSTRDTKRPRVLHRRPEGYRNTKKNLLNYKRHNILVLWDRRHSQKKQKRNRKKLSCLFVCLSFFPWKPVSLFVAFVYSSLHLLRPLSSLSHFFVAKKVRLSSCWKIFPMFI